MSRERVLVTGASGFLGRALLAELAHRDAEVDAVSRHGGDRGGGARWHGADLVNADAVDRLFETTRPKVVFHLASEVTGRRDLDLVRPTLERNLMAAVHVLVAAWRAGCRRIVLAGSMEAPDLFAGEVPASPYAAAKAGQALYARLFHALYAAPIVSARIFMVYGPGQRDLTKLVPYTILEGLAGRAPQLANAERALDWIYVDDVARGLAALAKAPAIEGQSLDLGTGIATPVADVAARIARATGGPAPVLGVLAPRALETERVADPATTLAATGFAPEVDLDDGLARTVAWYRTWRGRKEPSQVATSSS